MSEHRWSGWPGAWCLDCGQEDQMELCVSTHHVLLQCTHGHWQCDRHPPLGCDVHVNGPCYHAGEGLADPYLLNEKRRDFIRLLVRRLGDVLEMQECPDDYFGINHDV